MIVELLLDVAFGIMGAVVDVLPDMVGWDNTGQWKSVLASANYLVPVEEFVAALPMISGLFAALGVWRVVRLIRGG